VLASRDSHATFGIVTASGVNVNREEALVRGRQSLEARAWSEAFEQLSAADRESSLAPAELEQLARVAQLLGRSSDVLEILARVHQGYLAAGDLPSAIRVTVRNAVTGEVLTVSSAVKVHVNAPALCASAQAQDCKDLNATINNPNAANNPAANPAAPNAPAPRPR